MITLIIDGAPIAYSACFAALKRGGDPADIAHDAIQKLRCDLRADRVIVALSDSSRKYWRHDLDPNYKAGRADPPAEIRRAHEGLSDNTIVRVLAGIEAKDIIGILATDLRVEGRKVIVATDEHLLTIPGEHHRPKHFAPGKTVRVGRAEAEFRHLIQTLQLIKGIGPEKAEKAINLFAYTSSPANVWRQVVAVFRAHKMTDAQALQAAQLARICRAQDFNFETLTPVLWQPPADDYNVHYEARAVEQAAPAQTVPAAASLFGESVSAEVWK